MPHTHRWSGDGRPPGIYCSGHLRNGEACRQMLASYVGGGKFVVTRDRLIALVGCVEAIRCPICGTDNSVNINQPQLASVVYATSTMQTIIMSGAGQSVA